jgi:hypothetical protein
MTDTPHAADHSPAANWKCGRQRTRRAQTTSGPFNRRLVNRIELSPIPVDADLSPIIGNPPASDDIKADWTFEMTGISGLQRLLFL